MKVKIKTWEAMVDEFGALQDGSEEFIRFGCGERFDKYGDDRLPPDRILNRVRTVPDSDTHEYESFDTCGTPIRWMVIPDMIEVIYSDGTTPLMPAYMKISTKKNTTFKEKRQMKKFTEMTDAERKKIPVYDGFIRYFPNAIVAVAQNSMKGNEQHNPGKDLFWDRSKSSDEVGSGARHLIDQAIHQNEDNMSGQIDAAASKAWRAMADLEKLLEASFES